MREVGLAIASAELYLSDVLDERLTQTTRADLLVRARLVAERVRSRLRAEGVDPSVDPDAAWRIARAEVRRHDDLALARGDALIEDEAAFNAQSAMSPVLVHGAALDSGTGIAVMLLMALVAMLRLSVYFAIMLIVLQVILSWVNPYSPLAPVVNALTRPLLAPIQRIVPPIGMVDLSPLVALLLLQLVLMVPVEYLERLLGLGF